MLPRYMIRRPTDEKQLYFAVESGSTQKVMVIKLIEETPGKVEMKEFFSLQAGNIVALQLDRENNDFLYLVDDYQNVM